jgi:hypothetical protein
MVYFKIKAVILLIVSFMMSLAISELAIRYIVGYPDYGIDNFVFGVSSNIKWQAQYRPYSRYINTEQRGFHPYRRNNLGLPGTDIDVRKDLVFVLGSSFIEAAQVPPEQISVSIFSKLLKESRLSSFTAVNLGRKAHDLYDSWFRYQYYKNILNHRYVMLIVDQRNSFARHKQPFEFGLPAGFGKIENRLTKRLGTIALSRSAYLALMFRGVRDLTRKDKDEDLNDLKSDGKTSESNKDEDFIKGVLICLREFSTELKNQLIVVSIINKPELNEQVKSYCDQNGIYCMISDTIQIKENQIDGSGHFNLKGNRRLGELMFSALQTKLSKDQRESQ